jgi:ubiquinone/menaquinone biosynthesis C-methylase UbiE
MRLPSSKELTSQWFWPRLVCPIDRSELRCQEGLLKCSNAHIFPVIDGIPVLLFSNGEPLYPGFEDPGMEPALSAAGSDAIDPFVQQHIVRTNGKLYRSLQGRLKHYPIPELPLPEGRMRSFLDVGSNWGRWTVAAAQKGYRAVGIESSLAAASAGQRIARQLGIEVGFVVGDARHMPFRDGTFDVCFSYSVLQHFEKKWAAQTISEMARVTQVGGRVLVQMANRFGLLQTANRLRQVLGRNRSVFRVRYWTSRELVSVFSDAVGPSQVYAAGFLSLNAQAADLNMLPWPETFIVRLSELMRKTSRRFPLLSVLADSLYVESWKT